MNLKTGKGRVNLFNLFISLWIMASLVGCDAFVRKFTRKPKKENLPREELVLQPEEYKGPQMSHEQLYRQYYLFWQSWHAEFIEALNSGVNHKKQISCAEEALKNLVQMRAMLDSLKQKQLDLYIEQLSGLKSAVESDSYGNELSSNRTKAERLRMRILKDFVYNKVKGSVL